jgi:hypothetical protein
MATWTKLVATAQIDAAKKQNERALMMVSPRHCELFRS